jgi:hypothetical protein
VPYSHRDNLPPGSIVYDVSSYGEPPWHTFSPIYIHGGVPVPGMPGTFSDTVEGIWQGLKVIRGKIAPHLFRGRGQKRGGKPAGHQFGDRLLGLVEARRKIYQPAYEWVLQHRIDPALIEQLIAQATAGVTQYFHDVGDNSDINRDEPWAHASLLVQYLNRLLS